MLTFKKTTPGKHIFNEHSISKDWVCLEVIFCSTQEDVKSDSDEGDGDDLP